MNNQNLILCLFLLFPFLGFTQALTEVEYFFDADPGFGNGTEVSFESSNGVADVNFQADLTGVSEGLHVVYVRVKDENGGWSLSGYRPFYYNPSSGTDAPDLSAIEYFIDEDPGFGNGTSVGIGANSGAISIDFDADLSGTSKGTHVLYVRTQDTNGAWSLSGYRHFYYDPDTGAEASDLVAVEYFIDEDPGFGNGTAVSVNANSGAVVVDFEADLAGVSNGVHILYVRAKDANGSWSLTGYRPFYYNAASGGLRDITAMEYFWDEDPGFASGIPIDFAQPGAVVMEDVELDYSFLSRGIHTYYIRVKDEAGVWSLTATGEFDVPCLFPVNRETSNRNPTSARLNWSIKQESEGFEIRGNRVGAASFLTINAGAEDSIRFAGGLQTNKDYFWQIRSVCAVGDTSDWSVPDTFFTTCPVVQNLTTTDITTNSATFNWDPIPGADGYVIQGGIQGASNFTTLNVNNGGAGQRTVNVLQPNRDYQWRIRAVCEDDAPFSELATFSTPAAFGLMDNSTANSLEANVYPNPNGGVFFVELNRIPNNGHYEIYDVLGRKVVQSSLHSTREEINLSEKGLYTLMIYELDQVIESLKLIVR